LLASSGCRDGAAESGIGIAAEADLASHRRSSEGEEGCKNERLPRRRFAMRDSFAQRGSYWLTPFRAERMLKKRRNSNRGWVEENGLLRFVQFLDLRMHPDRHDGFLAA